MRFCTNCDNMYYIQITGEKSNTLEYYCRKCGHKNNEIDVENVSISTIQMKQNEKQFNNIVNKYTKLDPTLPRTDRVLCPVEECPTNTAGVPREIIQIRYDYTNMKYINLFSACDTVWKIN
jgi:DNA-directed RNA polymerase subunit M/transcription elongation factor TFIIS